MTTPLIGAESLRRALSLRDLTDPSSGPHAMQILLGDATRALIARWDARSVVHRAPPLVSIADNYDRLHYPPEGVARDARYTRYVTESLLLRTQTSAMVPSLLRALAASPPVDALLACPGLVYRRDSIDRLHTGEPHQVDLWRVRTGAPLTPRDLDEMIELVVAAMLPGRRHRTTRAEHPYTQGGLQIDVEDASGWIEIGECGLAHPALLDEAGLDSTICSGLAMGLGLDRILMLRKGIDDIRLLRSEDLRVAAQMLDLEPYRIVSTHPPIRRDLSIAVAATDATEDLGDRVREALGDRASSVEEVAVLSETPRSELPPSAIARLGLQQDQKNVLVRVVLRDVGRTLTHAEANELRDAIYAALHRGSAHEWASGHRPA